jgi:hypothetical protein
MEVKIYFDLIIRGTADHGKAPFRASYARVGNIKALVNAPTLCLTATAGAKTRKKIIQMLHMVNTNVIYLSPDKENIKYVVEKVDKAGLDVTFGWIIEDLKQHLEACPKTIIFCTSFKECGELYDTFSDILPDSFTAYYAMYHSKTPERIKEQVLSDIVADGNIRIVIATSALGMGINIPDIQRIIHYGAPQDIESYVQAAGRGGRNGCDVLAILYYKNYHLRHCDEKMRAYIKNNMLCRRLEILKYFNEKQKKSLSLLHNCCDICSLKCACESCPVDVHRPIEEGISASTSLCDEGKENSLTRCPTSKERETFVDVLKDIQQSGNATVFGTTFLKNMLKDSVINKLASDLENLFSVEYITRNFPILDHRVACEILNVVSDIFQDIDKASIEESHFNNWVRDDFYFFEVTDSYESDESACS